jgi:hypothetical protein
MVKLAAARTQSQWDEASSHPGAPQVADDAGMTGQLVARARMMMIVSGVTTLVAVAAVIGVIGYRVFHAGGSGIAATADAIVTLPKGARVVASSVAGDRIVVTLDSAGATEIRTFDLKTLKETGRLRFATEP